MTSNLSSAVQKSSLDDREYRALLLPNKLRVLLVNDNQAEIAVAALNVSVGFICDPKSRGGLAHLCEHMLFVGSRKYPGVNDFRSFIAEHGGSYNGSTMAESTLYRFNIALKKQDTDDDRQKLYWGALDRFSQMFISPLFPQEAVGQEIKTVNSEYEAGLQQDIYGLLGLLQSSANPNHPFNNFAVGNCETLDKPDSRDLLLQFFEKFYSANLMTLVLVAPFSLDMLQEYAEQIFGNIPNKEAKALSHAIKDVPLFRKIDLGKKHYVCPVNDVRDLRLLWIVRPPYVMFRSKPHFYVREIITHEGPGSLLSVLKKRGWATEVTAETLLEGLLDFGSYSFFIVHVKLTRVGLDHVDDLIEMIHGYITFLRNQGVRKWIHDECKAIQEIMFRFKDKEEPEEYACFMARTMTWYGDPELYLKAPNVIFDYSEESIRQFLSDLSPKKLLIFISSRKFESTCSTKAKWYPTLYSVENIPENMMKKLNNARVTNAMIPRSRNKFIPVNFDLIGVQGSEGTESQKEPVSLSNERYFKLYHKLDLNYRVPKGEIFLLLESPKANSSPIHKVLTDLYVLLLEESLKEHTYEARIAGLSCCIYPDSAGIQLIVKGFSDRIDLLFSTVVGRLGSLEIDLNTYGAMKDKLMLQYARFSKIHPAMQAFEVVDCAVTENWANKLCLRELETGEITTERLQQFIPTLLGRLDVKCLVHGNLSREWAKKLREKLQSSLKLVPLQSDEIVVERASMIPKGKVCIYKQLCSNCDEKNSALEIYYQVGTADKGIRTLVALEVLTSMLRPAVYTELRTEQRLAYIVQTTLRRHHNVVGFNIVVQSAVASPDELEDHIESVLQNFGSELKLIHNDKFVNIKNGAKVARLERTRTLTDESKCCWDEIRSGACRWNRKQLEIDALDALTVEDIIEMHSRFVARKGTERRKFVSKIFANGHDITQSKSSDENHGILCSVVDDVVLFRKSLGLWPSAGGALSKQSPKPSA